MTNIKINIGIYLVKMFQKRKLKKQYKSSSRKETVPTTTMVPLKTSETSSTTVSKISTKDNSYTVKEDNDSLRTETSQGTTTLSTHFPTTEISSTPVSVTENPIFGDEHTLTVDKSEMKDEIEYKNKATNKPEIVETTTDKQTSLPEDIDDDDSSKSEDDDYVLGSADIEDSV
uniref:Uncharacterized protein n=1 Tax=Parastrongyloides trichosuri TaxID=131310 RepID=A0A0N4ZDD7_PARTI